MDFMMLKFLGWRRFLVILWKSRFALSCLYSKPIHVNHCDKILTFFRKREKHLLAILGLIVEEPIAIPVPGYALDIQAPKGVKSFGGGIGMGTIRMFLFLRR